jgi:class 3 adenylate cyclase
VDRVLPRVTRLADGGRIVAMPICVTCGESNPERARFCLGCGTPLAQETGGEMRQTVTIVFCDLTGSTALGAQVDAEAVRGTLIQYHSALREILERHGGQVEKFIGDAVMAVFGVPRSHEDDALRAVRTAVEMRDEVSRLGPVVRYLSAAIRKLGARNRAEAVASAEAKGWL